MLYKRCSICHKRIPISKHCHCGKVEKAKVKDGNEQIHDDFYKTQEWQCIRTQAIAKFFGLDIYSLLVYRKIEYGQTVHHIIPIEDDFSKRCDINNLIYLTEANHRKIHKLYKIGKKTETQEFLLKLVSDFACHRGYSKMF